MTIKTSILFDFDGTLTVPMLNFPVIREELGFSTDRSILDQINDLDGEEKKQAEDILFKHEQHASQNATLQPGVQETLSTIRDMNFSIGIITRNARQWVMPTIEKYSLDVDVIHTREDGPPKPLPDPIFSVCQELGTDPNHSWMIGDHLMDLQSGKSAGCRTILYQNHLNPSEDHWFDFADHVIDDISKVVELVQA